MRADSVASPDSRVLRRVAAASEPLREPVEVGQEQAVGSAALVALADSSLREELPPALLLQPAAIMIRLTTSLPHRMAARRKA